MTTEKNKFSGLPEDLDQLVRDICSEYEKEDRSERMEKKALWIKLENYMNGIQRLFYDMVARDWKQLDEDYTARHYDKVINIYRAHLEAITAALSIKLPSAIFYPEDADVSEDVITAQVCHKVKEIIERHNEAKLKFIRAIVTLFNCGVVAAYIYNRRDAKYGTYKRPQFSNKTVKVTTVNLNCPDCGSNIDEIIFKGDDKKKIPEEVKKCPVCGHKAIPIQDEYEDEIPEIIAYGETPKSRTIIEIFSPLFVHMPFYARSQELMPWLKLEFEQHYSLLRSTYPKLYKENQLVRGGNARAEDAEERGLRIETSSNLVTTKCWWVRPWGYDVVSTSPEIDKKIERLREKFPDGFYAVIIDDKLAEIHNEVLDDHWQISHTPLSTYIHGEPIGKPLAPIQDLTNEVVDLQIETFEHAIPETFADATVLNFDAYGKSRAMPGMVYPAKPPADGQPLSSAFHSIKTATLSEESDLFLRKLDDKGQFVVGSFPSIYGGPATSGSRTAREYTESRSMALQRLTLPFNILKFWWKNVSAVAVKQFIQSLKKDEEDYKEVIKTSTGFVNQWIRQSDIQGNIGQVEVDPDEDLPQSPAQLKDIFLNLIGLKDKVLNTAIFHPENTPFLARSLGYADFYIPGYDDRNKQYKEINELLKGGYVEVRPWENHRVEAETLKQFLVSPPGLIAKRDNPEGYANAEQHLQEHIDAMTQQPAPAAETAEGV